MRAIRGKTWAHLLADPHRLRYGFAAVLLVGLDYGITEGGIALSGGMPSTPWLAIPPVDYFKWEALFSAPVTVLSWILAAGVIHLLSRLFGGHGTFDDTSGDTAPASSYFARAITRAIRWRC